MKNGDAFSLARTPEEKLLARQAADKVAQTRKSFRTAYTKFLTPAEAAFLRIFCERSGFDVVFDGGREGTERVVALFPPEWLEASEANTWIGEESPVTALLFRNAGDIELSHRDYLGALMAAGIRRDTVGDIDIHGAEAYVFCLSEIAEYIVQNLESAGKARLEISRVSCGEVPPPIKEAGQPIYDTVSSVRLDAIVAAGLRLSREDAKALVTQGACSVNHLVCEKPDAAVEEGSLISVRGKGRLRLEKIRGATRRGRIGLDIIRFGK